MYPIKPDGQNLIQVTITALGARCTHYRVGPAKMYRFLRNGPAPRSRAFSNSAPTRARRTIQEIRQSRAAPPAEEPTPEEIRKLIAQERDRAFGPNVIGDPTTYVNKAADEVWKKLLKASNNDPRVFNAWRDDIKSRATMTPGKAAASSNAEKPPKSGKRG